MDVGTESGPRWTDAAVASDQDPPGSLAELAAAHPPGARRWYAFALKDAVPLPEHGYTTVRHGEECRSEGEELPSHTSPTCGTADVCRLIPIPGTDTAFTTGLRDLTDVVDRLTNRAGSSPALPDAAPSHRVVAVVGAPWSEGTTTGEHYTRCFDLLRDTVKALRHASGARVPNVSIERVWPLYVVLDEDTRGAMEFLGLIMVEHGFPGSHKIPTEELAAVEAHLVGAWQRSPVEVFRDFELDARNAAHAEGDYIEAVLKAAAAAEMLIKVTAWMLTWEATTQRSADLRPDARREPGIFDAKPSQLIGGVLVTRLGGNWNSQNSTAAVGAWRQHIARVRNSVIHRGHRPEPLEADEAVLALKGLVAHIGDRLADKANVYPRTAVLLAGRQALEKRGAWGKVRATVNDGDLNAWLPNYVAWLDANMSDDAGVD